MDKKSLNLDKIDCAILELLQEDSVQTTKELASQLNLTTTPVFERVKRLEREGYIENYTALLNRKKIGLPMLVFCDVSLKAHNRGYLLQFEEQIAELPEVIECHHVAGAYDYLLKVVARDIDGYQLFIKEKLANLDNIGQVQSHIVMTEVKNSTIIPVCN